MANNRKLGRVSSHRKAMLRNLATDVIMHGKIETTDTRAKEVRKVVEELITLGKRGDLHARRQAAAVLQDVVDPKTGKTALQKLFDEVAPKYADRNGGYTKVLKTYNRKGDNATMAIITLFFYSILGYFLAEEINICCILMINEIKSKIERRSFCILKIFYNVIYKIPLFNC